MMGGVLQIRREDELKKDIPPPAFSLERPPEEWTQDEVKLYQIYEQKVKDLQEEREKLKKVYTFFDRFIVLTMTIERKKKMH